MNYRHCYHAGSFADVVKHVVLIVLLQALQRKAAPFCFLESHAGIGLYELKSGQAQKKQEYENGIAKLFSLDKDAMPTILQDYIRIVQKYNTERALKIYPGSPVIAKALLRPQDQMILCELHQEDYATLKENFFKANNVAIHHMDGYLGMKAFLPPKLKRGLVLIDPAFEVLDEFSRIFQTLKIALTHWRSGHFMIWYPIKNQSMVQTFYRHIKTLEVEQLIIHFTLNQVVEIGKLSTCGILFIHPPWQLKENLALILPYLSAVLQASWEFFI